MTRIDDLKHTVSGEREEQSLANQEVCNCIFFRIYFEFQLLLAYSQFQLESLEFFFFFDLVFGFKF